MARTLRKRDREEGREQRTLVETLNLLEPRLLHEPQALERRAEGSQLIEHIDALEAARAAG